MKIKNIFLLTMAVFFTTQSFAVIAMEFDNEPGKLSVSSRMRTTVSEPNLCFEDIEIKPLQVLNRSQSESELDINPYRSEIVSLALYLNKFDSKSPLNSSKKEVTIKSNKFDFSSFSVKTKKITLKSRDGKSAVTFSQEENADGSIDPIHFPDGVFSFVNGSLLSSEGVPFAFKSDVFRDDDGLHLSRLFD